MTSVSDFTANRLGGAPEPLSTYAGKVILIVNVASKCGYTGQYTGLEKLWRDYRDRGLVVLGFPCNQFANEEPGRAEEIAAFCSTVFDVTFPMFDKIDVNGSATHPLYRWLKQAAPGMFWISSVKWNFTKFLVARDGQTVRRFATGTEPEAMATQIEALLSR